MSDPSSFDMENTRPLTPEMIDTAIDISGLAKTYGSTRRGAAVHALLPLDLRVVRGEVFGLLGPNGAGKTTLVKLLLGVVHPTMGLGRILGHPIGTVASRLQVGYLPENHRYPSYLTGRGVLEYFGRLSGVSGIELRSRIDQLLELVGMGRWGAMRVAKYSKGMLQRIGLAQAMINDPEVLFLDEPTDGVDPVGRKEIREVILRLRDRGKTIFLNSHLLSEVELVCDRVAILDHGRQIRIGTIPELTHSGNRTILRVEGAFDMESQALLQATGAEVVDSSTVILNVDVGELNALIDTLRMNGMLLTAITPMRPTLEEIFIDVIEQEDSR